MKNLLLYFMILGFTFISCTTNESGLFEDSDIHYRKNMPTTLLNPLSDVQPAIKPPACGNLQDYNCTNGTYLSMIELIGDNSGGINANNGILDYEINCPLTEYDPCDRACPSITQRYTGGYEPVTIWYQDLNDPCGDDGVFTASEQQAFLDLVKQLAVQDAPLCNGKKMTPVHYNLLWDFIVFGEFYISFDVTYKAPCVALDG